VNRSSGTQKHFLLLSKNVYSHTRCGYTAQMTERVKVKRKNPAAVALGKLGASKGGKARAAKLSPEQRSEIARKAVLARWRRK